MIAMDLIIAVILALTGAEACEHEDGSTQSVCVWDGGANGRGHTVLNLFRGRFHITLD